MKVDIRTLKMPVSLQLASSTAKKINKMHFVIMFTSLIKIALINKDSSSLIILAMDYIHTTCVVSCLKLTRSVNNNM